MPEMDIDLQKFAACIAGGPSVSGVVQEAANSPVNAGGNFDRDACSTPAREHVFKPQSPTPGMSLA